MSGSQVNMSFMVVGGDLDTLHAIVDELKDSHDVEGGRTLGTGTDFVNLMMTIKSPHSDAPSAAHYAMTALRKALTELKLVCLDISLISSTDITESPGGQPA